MYNVPKEIPIVIQNCSNFDYYFIIKELAEKSEKQVTYVGEKTKNYINFPVPREKEVIRIEKKRKRYHKNFIYRLLQDLWQALY